MLALFLRNVLDDSVARPPTRCLFDAADIENTMVQIFNEGRVRLLAKECFVRVNSVSGQERRPRLPDVLFHIS